MLQRTSAASQCFASGAPCLCPTAPEQSVAETESHATLSRYPHREAPGLLADELV